MTILEKEIRQRLGVPETVTTVMILGMNAHMDWDWLNTFQALVQKGNQDGSGSVEDIISQAWELMIRNQDKSASYMYSICEMGFLRAALQAIPELLTAYKNYNLGPQIAIDGGGITSPDNLLPHGEAFIRNYLLGWDWELATLGLTPANAYMPDDFGHDAQLPVMLEAMGFQGVVFSRMPGSWASSQTNPKDGSTSIYQQLMTNGADLFWQGSDGSSIQTHLEQNGYQQGNGLSAYCGDPQDSFTLIQQYLAYNQTSSLSPYIYVPCGNDFSLPIPCLLDIAEAWNVDPPDPSVSVVVGTMANYMQLVASWNTANPGKLVSRTMDPTPYWTGFYASRPANKILHHATVRTLLAAEAYGTIAGLLQTTDVMAWAPVLNNRQQAIANGWEALVPSTHHDYITGTAVDSVYTEEQVPLLRAARSIAEGARDTAINSIATLIGTDPGEGQIPIAVFNALGFAVTGLAELPLRTDMTINTVVSGTTVVSPVQVAPDGKLLSLLTAPALGYNSYCLSTQPYNGPALVSVSLSPGSDFCTIQNAQLKVTIQKSKACAISALQPIVNGTLQASMVPTGQMANTLVFYKDLGNIYNFGNEFDDSGLSIVHGTQQFIDIRLIENGPLRGRVQATLSFSDGTSTATYTLLYTLVAGEPFLRMSVTGSAPLPSDTSQGGVPYAVMVRFPFAFSDGSMAPVDGVLRGTPYHWHDLLPVPYWKGPAFQATHHFVVPAAGDTSLGALYHADIPAWAIDDSGAMIGCILRNTPATFPWPVAPEGRGADGVDFSVHTREYALRIPQGMALPPGNLGIFQESYAFSTPLQGAYVNVPDSGVSPQHPVSVSFPASYSLASVVTGNAMITVAKEGQFNQSAMILRIYQPSNGSQQVTLSLAGYIQATNNKNPQVMPVTALEQAIPGVQPLPVSNGEVIITMDRALVTLEVSAG